MSTTEYVVICKPNHTMAYLAILPANMDDIQFVNDRHNATRFDTADNAFTAAQKWLDDMYYTVIAF